MYMYMDGKKTTKHFLYLKFILNIYIYMYINGRHHFFDDRSHGVGMQKVPPPPIWGVGQLWTKLHTGE